MMKNLGVFVLLIGAIILIVAGFSPSSDSNTSLLIGLLLVIGGFIAHIVLNRRIQA